MSSEAALIVWSAVALVWWILAWRLVHAVPADLGDVKLGNMETRFLTIFKPLVPLTGRPFSEASGLESFIRQLDDQSELLLGAHEADRAVLESFLEQMRFSCPRARVHVLWRVEPDSVPNPKVAWLKILAPHANGELWMWSDADIIAPADFLKNARAEYARVGVPLVTWPYVVRDLPRPEAVLDALFVNAEFFPGVLLLRRRGPVDFGLGAAMLFSRADFESRVGWDELGAALADDFVMGQKLRPVRIGRAILTTNADAGSWRAALRHYLRWSKTIRWNRPVGTAARVIVLPVLGWIAWIAWQPASLFGWIGLLVVMQMDVVFAALICARIGCRLRVRDLAVAELWSVGRAWVWLICWLPGSVTWSGRRWRGPAAS